MKQVRRTVSPRLNSVTLNIILVYGESHFSGRDAYVLTNEELETLMNIANYCPIKYGQGVYSARVMIRSQPGYETSYWNDEELCISGIDYRKANPNSDMNMDSLTNLNFVIYPNPASTELNFKLKNTDVSQLENQISIQVFDILGSAVIEKRYEQNVRSSSPQASRPKVWCV